MTGIQMSGTVVLKRFWPDFTINNVVNITQQQSITPLISQLPTCWWNDNWLQLPLLPSRGQRDGQSKHRAQRGAHVQAGCQSAVPLSGKGLTKVEGADGLSRLLVDTGDAGGAWAAERIVPVV